MASSESVLTEPEEVARFVERDRRRCPGRLDRHVARRVPFAADAAIERLKELTQPALCRWCSTAARARPTDQVRAAVRNGICKVNIYADCRIAMGRGLRSRRPRCAAPTRCPPKCSAPSSRPWPGGGREVRLLLAEGRAAG